MALNAYAELTANGDILECNTSVPHIADIDVSSDHIECFSVSWGSRLNTLSSTRRRGRVTKLPVTLLKPIDKSTPLLYQAMATNQRIDGPVKIFDVDPESGVTRHFFTVKLERATIISLESKSPNTLNSDTAASPPSEQVELSAYTLTYIDEINEIEYQQR
jgi:type VI secretion system secreted protein Hcp